MNITPQQQADIEETRQRLLVYLNTGDKRRTYADIAAPCGVAPDVIRDFLIGTRKSPRVAQIVCDRLPLGIDFVAWHIVPS